MNSIADYYDGMEEIIKASKNKEIFKISPSSIEDFFTMTSQYYREQVLGEDKAFKGSTSTHLGTIVHALAEATAKREDMSDVEDKVDEFLATIKDPEVDKATIQDLWFSMGAELVNNTILKDSFDIHSTEKFIYERINDDVYVGGTYDCLIKDPAIPGGYVVVDYKTAASKPRGFSRKYKYQAYAYAWMLREQGVNVTRVQLSFVTRPTTTLPVRYFEFSEPYTNDNHAFMDSILGLIAESISKFKHSPELRHLLAQDARLKAGPKLTTFPGGL